MKTFDNLYLISKRNLHTNSLMYNDEQKLKIRLFFNACIESNSSDDSLLNFLLAYEERCDQYMNDIILNLKDQLK